MRGQYFAETQFEYLESEGAKKKISKYWEKDVQIKFLAIHITNKT